MTNKETRYQDYVIKDGKPVYRFEEMYAAFDDPWHQSEAPHNLLSVTRNIALLSLRRHAVTSVVEFGCGLGYYTDIIRRSLGGGRVLGVDVSPTAIGKASARFPECSFVADDVTNLSRYAGYDAILFAEITWYVLERLPSIFEEMLRSFQGKYFLHNLVFYKGDTQKYGREYFTSLQGFIDYCPLRLISRAEYTTGEPGSTIETSTVFRIEPKLG